MEIRYAISTRKHGITEFEIKKIILENNCFELPLSRDGRRKVAWFGEGSDGEMVEVITVIYDTHYFAIHAMPIKKRKGNLDDIKSRIW